MNYIATFHTHLSALRSCAALKSRGINGRLAPVPRRISSSCGTCVLYQGEDMALEAMDRDLEAVWQAEAGEYTCLYQSEE